MKLHDPRVGRGGESMFKRAKKLAEVRQSTTRCVTRKCGVAAGDKEFLSLISGKME